MSVPLPFSPRTEYTPVPNLFFGAHLERIKEPLELKAFLRLFFLLHLKRGFPQFVSLSELASDPVLLKALVDEGRGDKESLKKMLEGELGQALFLNLRVNKGTSSEELYLLNTPTNRRAIERVQRGELSLPELPDIKPIEVSSKERPSIFDLYEANIGILTPLVAEELKGAEQVYPYPWIEEAFREAATRNKLSWSYISAILQRWMEEGKEHGEPGRHPQKTDPKEYIRGYGKYIRTKHP